LWSVTSAVWETSLPRAVVRPYSTSEVDGSSVCQPTVAWPSASAVAVTADTAGALVSFA
jgi:hypothetical protein